MKYDLYDIMTEINAISMIVTGIANQIGEDRDSLQTEPLKTALFGVSNYLDRVADSLDEIDDSIIKAGATHEREN